jgi:hypothetical protein
VNLGKVSGTRLHNLGLFVTEGKSLEWSWPRIREHILDRSWGGGSQPRRAAQDRVYIVVSLVRGHCILILRASLGKVVHTVKRAGTYAAKVSHKELHKIAVHVRAVVLAMQ